METNAKRLRSVNNDIYTTLGPRWYEAQDDPVALLRAEATLRNPWIAAKIAAELGPPPRSVLDIGCGAGFLANYLAGLGHRVSGLDRAADALSVAARHDRSGSVDYRLGDACALPYAPGCFDVVCAMDFLEHIEEPEQAVAEAARVLAPSGLFFFHTFNRNWLSWLVVVKGVEWFIQHTPPNLHVLRLFLKPKEVAAMCEKNGLDLVEMVGSRPCLGRAFWRMLRTGEVPVDLSFKFTPSTLLAFNGFARKPRA
jgi:2-polyprenyl-6-hydroxyphenyl methylase/3-demethylubiquinone-9 3-methyltransferase